MQNLKTIELFAGIGGFRLAADKNNLETIWANDIDPIAAKVYKDAFGEDIFVEGDIHDFVDEIPNHDILTGGFPCQPFSKAGKKQGIDDYRGTLFEVIVNVLKQKNPKYFILENVNSLLFMKGGSHFKTILAALSSLNYKIEWRVFNAASFGLAQHRERVIIVGSKETQANHSIFLEKDELVNFSTKAIDIITRPTLWPDIAESKRKFCTWGMALGEKYVSYDIAERQYIPEKKLYEIIEEEVDDSFDFTEDTLERIKNSQYVNRYYNGVQILYNQSGGARMGYSIFGTEGMAPTLTASTSRHYERYKIGDRFRRLTNVEYARIQGFPDHHCDATTVYNQYKLYGNAVPPQIIDYAMKKLLSGKTIAIESTNLSLFDFMEETK